MTASTDARVVDYLDDKLQTLADLESLDSLLISLRSQQSLLKQQLQDAHSELESAKKDSVQHGRQLKTRVQRFNELQQDIDRRLLLVTQSDASHDALQEFEASMQKLDGLNALKDYMQLLHHVDKLYEESLAHLGTSDAAAIDAYRRLRKLRLDIHPRQVAADGAAPHLIDHIQDRSDELKDKLETVFSAQLEAALQNVSWPDLHASVSESQHQAISNAISTLLDVQKPDLDAQEAPSSGRRPVKPLVLLPLQVFVKPLELAFRYHFQGDRPTNRLERPEFFLTHVIERILVRYIATIESYLQPILLSKFRGTDLALNYAYIDASSAFITSLLPMVRNKLDSVLPQIESNPPLLSHLIHELIKFDTQLRDDWQYEGGSRGQQWYGLAYEVLSQDDVFNLWLKAERDFALSRYMEIVDDADSFQLDFDSVGLGKTKPSKASIRVNDLLEATTDNYRNLTSFSQKLRFLIDIQISIFDLFHQRLAEALDAYLSRTSTIGRTSREDQANLQGLAGLERLSRIYGSAEYLERATRDWNDDVFFLELWSELQHRASGSSAHAVVAGSLTIAQVARYTSSAIVSETDPISGEQDFEEGALFDETATAYSRIRTKTEGIMADLLANNVRQALSTYSRINPWSTLAPTASSTDPQVSTTAELDGLLQSLRTLLTYLGRAVGTVSLRRITKQMLQTIDTTIIEQVILSHSFSAAGATQLSADIHAICNIIASFLDRGTVNNTLGRLNQAAQLLNIPVSRPEDTEGDSSDATTIGLSEAGRRLYEGSSDDARRMLEALGLDRLSLADARKVLARRVELGS